MKQLNSTRSISSRTSENEFGRIAVECDEISGEEEEKTFTTCQEVYFGSEAEKVSRENLACKCNATHCDHQLSFEWPKEDDSAFVRFVSSKSGLRFHKTTLYPTENDNSAAAAQKEEEKKKRELDYVLEVQVNKRRQQVVGFGGAFTDSATQLMVDLEDKVRVRLLEDYFGPTGLQYNLGRVPIAGTDMSSRAYSYDDLPAGQTDLELKHFKLQAEDLEYKVPTIRMANELRYKAQKPALKLMAASWSAPSWMKSNSHLVQGRLLGNSTHGPYYDAYARYQIKFLHEYEKLNLTIWALSPQNEPHSPKRVGPIKINFNSVNFEPHEMADYLEKSLVPQLIKAGKTPDKLKLFIWDDTLEGLSEYQEAALKSPDVGNFTLGLAIHWYTTGLKEKPYKMLYDARKQLPARYSLISTEASFIGRPKPGDWWRGERYARDLIENLRAGSVGWIDWNLALNMSGGPTWSHNILDSAILIDLPKQTYYKNPMFYALGHVSRFIEPNSHILQTSILLPLHSEETATAGQMYQFYHEANSPPTADAELTFVAAELDEPYLRNTTESGKILKRRLAVVILNRAKQLRRVQLLLRDCHLKRGDKHLEFDLEPNSLTSLAFVC